MTDAERPPFRTTLVERAAKRVDWAAVEAQRRDEAARASVDRINVLRDKVFADAARYAAGLNETALRNERSAAELLLSASQQGNSRLVLAIVYAAIDKRWEEIVRAGICHFGDQPVAHRIEELWNLTADRAAV